MFRKITCHARSVNSSATPLQVLQHVHESEPAAGLAALVTGTSAGVSIIGYHPIARWTLTRGSKPQVWIHQDYASTAPSDDNATTDTPLEAWQDLISAPTHAAAAPWPEHASWIGFVSYEMGRHTEIPQMPRDAFVQWPLMRWELYEWYLIQHTNAAGSPAPWQLVHLAPADAAVDTLGNPPILLLQPPRDQAQPHPMRASGKLDQSADLAALSASIATALRYIAAGDIYQVNLAARWQCSSASPPPSLFERLCHISPAEFSAYIQFDHHAIISASPELFIRRQGDHVITRPIKGTRRRVLDDAALDQQLARELLASEKDAAELAMIVDLLRNDLGRVCSPGSVKVKSPRNLDKLPTLWHTSATLSGSLQPQLAPRGWQHIIADMCPGGSITGAPKIRAMQIIGECEAFPRELYCGNIGWISPWGNGELNVAIRTMLMHHDKVAIYAGAGIVADSTPDDECREIMAKASAMLQAIGITAPP
ncbi:MAG: anthranilate synthase component I family protein [Phycisphaerales bacterium]|nr:anthranilate synthase component I family protein [Phycisphaerales bacterium]